jgi:molybdate transport system substrate-binding protein
MTRPGIRIVLANPESVFVGMVGAEIVDKAFNDQERSLFRKIIVTYAEDFSRLAALLVLKQVDAVIGFSYLNNWFPDKGADGNRRCTFKNHVQDWFPHNEDCGA